MSLRLVVLFGVKWNMTYLFYQSLVGFEGPDQHQAEESGEEQQRDQSEDAHPTDGFDIVDEFHGCLFLRYC